MVDRAASGGDGAVQQLVAEGVSPWLAGVTRGLLQSGRLAELAGEFGVRGASGDPGSMADEVRDGDVYLPQIATLATAGTGVDAAVWALLVADARRACDQLLPVFRQTGGYDGYFSVDLDPWAYQDSAAMVEGAREMARAVGRPNLLVRISTATTTLPTIRACLARGIGVHVAEVFSPHRHREVLHTYLAGMAEAHTAGLRLPAVASVCALPVVRLDREVDARLAGLATADARALRGRAGLATARIMYQQHDDWLGGEGWRVQREAGAMPQRPMWSTTAPRQDVPPVGYVQSLVAWGTVSEMTVNTLAAFAERGELSGDALTGQDEAARAELAEIAAVGVSTEKVAWELERDSGIRAAGAWRDLRDAVARRLAAG